MSDGHQYILDVDSNEIYVNPRNQIDHINATESGFTFQLLNPSRFHNIVFENINNYDSAKIIELLKNNVEVNGTSYINFFFPLGDDEQDFIDSVNAMKIQVHTENEKWSVSSGTIYNGFQNIIVSCSDRTELSEMLSLYIRFDHIFSYAKIGQTCFYVDIQNVVGIGNITKTFSITKSLSFPKILKFLSNKTTFKQAEQAELSWHITNEKIALLQPGNIDINEMTELNQLNVDVNKNIEYQLSVSNGIYQNSASINLYIVPPKIDKFTFEYIAEDNTYIISWSTQYANIITLNYNGIKENVKPVGNNLVNILTTKLISLEVTGHQYSEIVYIHLDGLLKSQQCSFEMHIKKFHEYVLSTWKWKTKALNSLKFQLSEDNKPHDHLFLCSTERNGTFSYLSQNIIRYSVIQCNSIEGEFELEIKC